MRVLRLAREAGDQRTGVFTSGIVATMQGRQIALYFTGPKHAGENLADVLKRRAAELPPLIQMSDALSRNVPKLPEAKNAFRCLGTSVWSANWVVENTSGLGNSGNVWRTGLA